MRVLIIGDKGQVGRELMATKWPKGTQVDGRGRAHLDITDAGAVDAEIAAITPDVIVNAAAYTQVDKAESERDIAFAANDTGAANLARAANDVGARLIHISTDYVFDGTKNGTYSEDDPVAPLGVYGESKEAGERAVRELCPAHVILRTAWVYSVHGGNFAKTMLRLGGEREELGVVADQFGTPTTAGQIADAIVGVVKVLDASDDAAGLSGTYHLTCAGKASWFDFAEAIFEIASPFTNKTPQLNPVKTEDYPTPAKRPANSVLDCAKFDRTFKVVRLDWADALKPIVENLVQDGVL